MTIKSLSYVSPFDAEKLKAYVYEVKKPKALVVVLHGMADHQARYKALALRLNDGGYSVLTIDQRGHGESLYNGSLKGHFSDKDGWQRNLEDVRAIVQMVNAEEKLPIILFGHSMGSVVARSYLKQYGSDLQALYLSGSPDLSPIASIGSIIAKSVRVIRGKKHPSPLLTKLSFGAFNKDIPDPKTPFDWVSADEDNIAAYNADPLCGFDCTTDFFVEMLKGFDEVYTTPADQWTITNPNLPIRFESGRQDPCHKPKGIEWAAEHLNTLGYKNITTNYIEGCRHEIYNDITREELMDSLVYWCKNVFKKKT